MTASSPHPVFLPARALAAALLLALLGCSRAPQAVWLPLTLDPRPGESQPTTLDLGTDGAPRRLVTRGEEARIELELAAADWRREGAGPWRAALGFVTLARTGHELRTDAHAYPLAAAVPAEGEFALLGDQLVLRLPEGSPPPPRALFSCLLRGPAPGGPGRIRGRRFSGEGLAVWPGAPCERRVDVPPASTLRFATAVDALIPGGAALPALVFRVELDGALLFEHTVEAGREDLRWHAVALPAAGRKDARLAFSVTGTPAYATFFEPLIGPSEVGRADARPWGQGRPDVVVFLADTFRADNLALHGSTLALAPHLDRFAGEALACARAWSVGTFTLSGHASLFSGLYPHQAGVFGEERALSEELVMLAELFRARGYRTGAITDSGIVSQAFAMEQGFATFDEGWRTLEETLAAARAFLDADDGRPVFLFVHTYRTHRPFRVSAETRAAHGARLGIEGEFEALEAELVALAHRHGHTKVDRAQDFPQELIPSAEARALIAKLQAHYRGGVLDLDRGFESLRQDLVARGLLASGVLVFTSDHGEAFGEHGQIYHKDDVYEEQTRIPLLLAGRGITPRVLETPVSLVDLAPTLGALADLPAQAGWQGRSLLGAIEERTLYSFECGRKPASSTFAVFDGRRKVIGLEALEALRAGRILAAYDQRADPTEREDLAGRAEWPTQVLARQREAVEHLLVPVVTLRAADLEAGKLAELRELGYVGD